MNRSTGVGVSGARPHRTRSRYKNVESEILIYMLCIQLLECYILNSIVSLTMNILYIYKRSAINEVWDLL